MTIIKYIHYDNIIITTASTGYFVYVSFLYFTFYTDNYYYVLIRVIIICACARPRGVKDGWL